MNETSAAADIDGEARLLAQVKRFREHWLADDRFRGAVVADPGAAFAAAGLDLDPAPFAFVWRSGARYDGAAPEIRAYRELDRRARDYLAFCADDGGAIEPYRAWRERQIARAAFAQGYVIAPVSLHLPFAVELTRGCSFGCWFCGLSASRLEAALPADLDAFEKTMGALHAVLGASGARGFLFWATDPLDHPDYEAFAEVFRRVFGRFPTTTTAGPHLDFDRTRRLMALARAGDCPGLRFSVVSLRRLGGLHATFTAEELADVDLVMVNRESTAALAEAGHARDVARRWPERAAHERSKLAAFNPGGPGDDDGIWTHRTIACVSGFLVQPVEGRVRLISPEPCSDRWPDGYAVFDEARFEDPAGFARALDRLVARNMKPDPPERLALQRGVTVEAMARTEVRARGRGHQVTVRAKRRDIGHLPALAEAFRGGAGVEETARDISRRFGIEPRTAGKDAATLWRQGVLVEPIFAFADADADTDADPDAREPRTEAPPAG